MWDHSDIRDDVREHVRVIGDAVQGGANMARGRIGDLLHNQTWPPRISPGPSTDGATTITNDEGKILLFNNSYSYGCFFRLSNATSTGRVIFEPFTRIPVFLRI